MYDYPIRLKKEDKDMGKNRENVEGKKALEELEEMKQEEENSLLPEY